MALTIVALLASAWVIVAYFYTSTTGKTRPLHFANAVGAPPIAMAAALAGAWGSVPLTVLFGLAGVLGLWKTRDSRPTASLRYSSDYDDERRRHG